jgi:hypothetical protein
VAQGTLSIAEGYAPAFKQLFPWSILRKKFDTARLRPILTFKNAKMTAKRLSRSGLRLGKMVVVMHLNGRKK